MNRRITLQESSSAQDAAGEPQDIWSDVGSEEWAEVRPMNGREAMLAQQRNAIVELVVTIRHRAYVRANMRVKFKDGTTAKVSYYLPIGMREGFQLFVEQVQ